MYCVLFIFSLFVCFIDDIITHELIANHKSRHKTKRNERQIIVNEDTIDIGHNPKSGSKKRLVNIGMSSGKSPNEDSLMNSLNHSSSDSEDEPLADNAQQPGSEINDYSVEEISTTKSTDTPLNVEDSPFTQFEERQKRTSYVQHMSEMSFGTDGLIIPSPIHSPENRILFSNPRYKHPNIIELMVDDDIDNVWEIFGDIEPQPIQIKPLSMMDCDGKKTIEAFFESQKIAQMVFELLNEQNKALRKSLKSPAKNDPLSSCQLSSILSDDRHAYVNDNDNVDGGIQLKQPQFSVQISNEMDAYASEEPYGIVGDPRIRHVDGDADNESLAWTEGSSPVEEIGWALGGVDVSGSSGGGWLDSDPEEENNDMVDVSQLQSSSILQK